MDGNIENIIDKKIDDIVKKNNIYHIGKVVKINNYIIFCNRAMQDLW